MINEPRVPWSDEPTPYSDRHAEQVKCVADTYDPQSEVVPKRKMVLVEKRLRSAEALLKKCVTDVYLEGVWLEEEIKRHLLAAEQEDAE